jgi:hypothetical protein
MDATMAGTRVEHHLDGGGHGRRPWRGALLAGLALALVVLVGLGSRAAAWDIGGPPRLADPSSYTGDLIVVGFALLVVLPWVIPGLRRRKRGFAKPEPDLPPLSTKWWVRMLAYLAVPAAVGLALLLLTTLPGAGRNPEYTRAPDITVSGTPGSSSRGRPHVHWWGYGLLALVGVGALAAVWYLRSPRPEGVADEEPDELLAAVDLSLEDLENEPDPRRAVIRAYARMEHALDSYGIARRPAETPLEYIARALTALRVGGRSVERLSGLFERAKFSNHEIDLTMKGDAIAALGALREELAGAAT